jgi:hypothetical protein
VPKTLSLTAFREANGVNTRGIFVAGRDAGERGFKHPPL